MHNSYLHSKKTRIAFILALTLLLQVFMPIMKVNAAEMYSNKDYIDGRISQWDIFYSGVTFKAYKIYRNNGEITGDGKWFQVTDFRTTIAKKVDSYTIPDGKQYALLGIDETAGTNYICEEYTLCLRRLYRVTFEYNGGAGTLPSALLATELTYDKMVNYGATKYIAANQFGLPTPLRDGYTFDGWYTEEEGGTPVTNDTVFTGTSDTTLYAHWTPDHIHAFAYSVGTVNEANTITATCGNTDNCSLTTNPTFKISAPESLIYDGSGKAAVTPVAYDKTAFSYVSPITYEKDGVAYNGTPTEVGTYTAYVTAGESSENCATATVSFTITKATPTITTNPSASDITYGQKLKDSRLTDGIGSVGGSFGWMSPETTPAVSDSDNTAYEVVFTPTDTSNYNTVNLNVKVHVNKADNPASVANSAAVTVGGNTINLADCVTMNGATGDVNYEISGDGKGCALSESVLTSGNIVGSVTVNVTVSEDANHNALDTKVINVTISDKGTQSISAENVTATYGDTDKSVNATVTTPETDGGAISYAVKPGSEEYIDVDASTGALTIKKTGTAIVVVTAEKTATYAQATKEVTVIINKAESPSENPAPTPKEDLTDNGHPQELINPVTVTGGTIEYVIGTDDSTPPTSGWGPTIPTAAAPGTYYVWYKVVGDENHQDSVPKCIIVTIAEAPVPADTPSGYVKDVTGTNEATGNYTFGQRIVNNGDLKTLLSLSDDEVSQGTKVWLDVTDLGNNAPESDKALVESAKGDYTIGAYLDINLFKKVGNNEAVKVTKTNGNVEVSLVMPENLRKEGRTFGIVRVHDNMATLISASYAGDSHLLTFKTDGFSTYAIVYKDGTNAGSNGSSNTNTSTGSNSSTGAATNIDTSIPKTDGAAGLMGWYLALIISSATLGALIVVSIKNRSRKKINK